MKKIILYYPFEFEPDVSYGSGVRLVNIYYSFVEFSKGKNIELIFIRGSQLQRLEQFNKLKKENLKNVVGCYIEMPNLPLIFTNKNRIPSWPLVDIQFMNFCRKNEIPLGGFVRDLHWKFEEYQENGFKHKFLDLFRDIYLSIYKKKFNVMFLPSKSMNEYIGFNSQNIVALPSGGKENYSVKNMLNYDDIIMIYVGSIHESTNISTVLSVLKKINSKEIIIKFNLICRQHEFIQQKEEFSQYLGLGWLNIKHLNSEDLFNEYNESHFAIMPHKKSIYHDFAMPVKLMEYLSHGMPILTTNINEVSNFVKKGNYGTITTSDEEGIENGIYKMLKMLKENKFQKEEIYQKFINDNKWIDRVKTIYQTFEGVRKM